MLKSNNTQQYKSISIHSFVDGFSFCTPNGIEFFPAQNKTEAILTSLKTFFDDLPPKPFDHYAWISFEYPSVFVPAPLYDPNMLSIYLRFFVKQDSNYDLDADYVETLDAWNVYPVRKKLKPTLKEYGHPFETRHANTLLVKNIMADVEAQEKKMNFYVHLLKGSFDLFVFEQKNLQYCNRFSFTDENEFLYFLFNVVEQYPITEQEKKIIFMGRYVHFIKLYEAVKKYHGAISFLPSKYVSRENLKQHQAPFLIYNSI